MTYSNREWEESQEALRKVREDWSNADLRGAFLVGRIMCGWNLSGADLRDANLSGADLRRADLSGADLRRADLRRADLYRGALDNADLRGAELYRVSLTRAKLPDDWERVAYVERRGKPLW